MSTATPEELLCSRRWRLVNGLWMLFGFVPFSALAWVGYLIIGVRARNWKWILLAVAFFAWIVGWLAWSSFLPQTEKGEPSSDPLAVSLWGWASVIVWLGNAFALQWFVNRRWLVWRAHHVQRAPWYLTATATNQPTAQGVPAASVVDDALRGGPAMSTTQTDAATLPTSGVLDVNTATREQLAALPGIDLAWADHIIAIRMSLGGAYTDPAQLVTAASVQPHIYAGLRRQISVVPPVAAPAAAPTTPVRPDPTPTRSAAPTDGRRLEF